MSQQIAIRLPEELVAFIDEEIASGHAPSRAQVVADALKREERRRLAMRDARILAGIDDDPEGFDELAAYSARQSLGLD